MKKNIDIKDFAQRVERVCDFLLAQASERGERDGSADINVIEQLKEEAADIQFNRGFQTSIIGGLDDYIRGFPKEP